MTREGIDECKRIVLRILPDNIGRAVLFETICRKVIEEENQGIEDLLQAMIELADENKVFVKIRVGRGLNEGKLEYAHWKALPSGRAVKK